MNRNYGIDLAKFYSMFMVVILHNLLNGGILSFKQITVSNSLYWYIENLAIVGVNVFALITGYLLVDKSFNYKRLFALWKTVIFWSIIPTFLFMLISRQWGAVALLKSCMPFVFKQYWYFNAYVGVVLLSPFINKGIKELDSKTQDILILALLLIAGSVGFIGHFFLQDGYSGYWLLVMYITGAYLKVTKRKFSAVSTKFLLCTYLMGGVISLVGEILSIKYVGHTMIWISYVSPIVIVQSITLFLLFQKFDVRNTNVRRLLKKYTVLTFAVYLIDANPIIYSNVLHSSLTFLSNQNLLFGVSALLLISVILFCFCLLFDFARLQLFKMLRM